MINPKIRRRARERALQFLYGQGVTGDDWEEALKGFWSEFATRASAMDYANLLVEGVVTHRAALDAHIDGALKNWSPKRVGPVERNILRIAVYEISTVDDVPLKVAINEAIEIAKSYGTDDSPGFVNGVLDRLGDAQLDESRR